MWLMREHSVQVLLASFSWGGLSQQMAVGSAGTAGSGGRGECPGGRADSMGRAWLVVGGQGRATSPQLPAQGVSCESLALAAMGTGCNTTGGSCESLALAALGSGCNTTARAAGTLTAAGLAVGAASPGKGAHVAGVPGCAIASSFCESLALAALGSGCNTTAWAAGTLTGAGLAVGAAAASGLGASPGKAAHVAGVSGCAIASSLVDMRAKG